MWLQYTDVFVRKSIAEIAWPYGLVSRIFKKQEATIVGSISGQA